MQFLRVALAFAIAVAIAAIGGSLISTTTVLQNQQALGLEIPASEWLSAYVHDVIGFAPVYGGVVAVGFVVAFLVAEVLQRLLPGLRTLAFTLAGGAAVFAALALMEVLLFEMPLIAAARTDLGVVALAGAGALGGFVYAKLA
jgi:hypothetical protein